MVACQVAETPQYKSAVRVIGVALNKMRGGVTLDGLIRRTQDIGSCSVLLQEVV